MTCVDRGLEGRKKECSLESVVIVTNCRETVRIRGPAPQSKRWGYECPQTSPGGKRCQKTSELCPITLFPPLFLRRNKGDAEKRK